MGIKHATLFHKYDPISQEDYYSMFAFFNPTSEIGHAVYGPDITPGSSLYYYGSPVSKMDDAEAKILRGVHDDYLKTQISFLDQDYEKAIEAMMCHKSQFQTEGLRKRMLQRKKGNKIYLRKFLAPQEHSDNIFQ